MNSYTSCEIAGNAGQDCRVFECKGGGSIVNVSIATSTWNSQKREKETIWTEVRVIGKQADWFRPRKGDYVHVSGAEYRVDEYENKEKEIVKKHYFLAGIGSRVGFATLPRREHEAPRTETEQAKEEIPF